MAKKKKVAVVDDHAVVRRGVSETFAEQPDFEVVAEGINAGDAARIAHEASPDLFILDVTMPGGGVEAVVQIRNFSAQSAILMLSIREDMATVRAALKAGASGYVSKGVDSDDLVSAARRVIAGERYVSADLAARLLTQDDAVNAVTLPPLTSLTAREREICTHLENGLSNQEIADRMGLSENTVKHYITPLLQKLGVRNRTEAAVLAQKLRGGGIEPPDRNTKNK